MRSRRRGRAIRRVLVAPRRARLNMFVDRFGDALAGHGRSVEELDWRLAAMIRSDMMIVHWPDLFFSLRHLPRALALLARIAIARAAGSRLIWVVHNLVPHAAGRRPSPAGALFVRSLDGVIFLSEASRALALDLHPALAGVRQLRTVHGEYLSTRPRTPFVPAMAGDAVRLLTFGLLRRYKNVERVAAAAAAMPPAAARLTVLGYSADAAYARELRGLGDDRVTIDARDRPIAEAELEAAIDAADAVVLPYQNILNSGSAFHALSRNRPVILPRVGAMPELQAAVGAEWVYLYDGAFDAARLADAIRWLRTADRAAAVDLGAYSWDRVAADLDRFLDEFAPPEKNGRPHG